AANLHHTNIVPVHFVGCDRGVHYYAMQLIEGCTLASIIGQLRRDSTIGTDEQLDCHASFSPAALMPLSGNPDPGRPMEGGLAPNQVTVASPAADADTPPAHDPFTPLPHLSTEVRSRRSGIEAQKPETRRSCDDAVSGRGSGYVRRSALFNRSSAKSCK